EGQIEQQQDDIAGEAVPAIERADQNDQHDHVLADDGDAKDLVILMSARQPNVQLASADEAASKRRENQSVGLRTDMKAADENDRRTGDVDEQARKREGPGESIGIKLRMDQDLTETFENGPRQQGDFRVRPMAFGQQQADYDHEQDREGRKDDEYPGPAGGGCDQAADRRRKQRRHAQHQYQQR